MVLYPRNGGRSGPKTRKMRRLRSDFRRDSRARHYQCCRPVCFVPPRRQATAIRRAQAITAFLKMAICTPQNTTKDTLLTRPPRDAPSPMRRSPTVRTLHVPQRVCVGLSLAPTLLGGSQACLSIPQEYFSGVRHPQTAEALAYQDIFTTLSGSILPYSPMRTSNPRSLQSSKVQ